MSQQQKKEDDIDMKARVKRIEESLRQMQVSLQAFKQHKHKEVAKK